MTQSHGKIFFPCGVVLKSHRAAQEDDFRKVLFALPASHHRAELEVRETHAVCRGDVAVINKYVKTNYLSGGKHPGRRHYLCLQLSLYRGTEETPSGLCFPFLALVPRFCSPSGRIQTSNNGHDSYFPPRTGSWKKQPREKRS